MRARPGSEKPAWAAVVVGKGWARMLKLVSNAAVNVQIFIMVMGLVELLI